MPEEKVIKRYENTSNLLFPVLKLIDKAYLFDNSTQTMLLFAKIKHGQIEIVSDKIPNWFICQLEKHNSR